MELSDSNLGLSFMISSAAPTRSSTSYAYLITKIGNRNLNSVVNFRNSSSNNGLTVFQQYKTY